MSRFRDEMDIVPRPAYAIGVCVWLAFFLLMLLVPSARIRSCEHGRLAAVAISFLPGIPLFFLVLLIGYVYADAKRRGMRYVMWTLLAALIPNAIGIILYFVLREPLLVNCTVAARRCGLDLRFCPKCGALSPQACPQCRACRRAGLDALRALWSNAAGGLTQASRGRSQTWYTAAPPIVARAVTEATGCHTMPYSDHASAHQDVGQRNRRKAKAHRAQLLPAGCRRKMNSDATDNTEKNVRLKPM